MENMNAVLEELIDHASTCYVAYIDHEGFPVAKAMLKPRKRTGLQKIWFSTNTSSNKVECYKQNSRASVYFIDQQLFKGVSLIGTMEIIDDPNQKKEIWQSGDELFYPKGITDPDYCVLLFKAQKCRFYSNFHSEDYDIV